VVHGLRFVTTGNQVLECALLASLCVVFPLTILCVVLLDKLVDVATEFTVKVGCSGVTLGLVELEHQLVDEHEVVDVVDLRLVASQVEDLGPDLLIVPTDEVKLPSEIEMRPLVMLHFRVPVGKNNLFLEGLVKQLTHVVSMQLLAFAESL